MVVRAPKFDFFFPFRKADADPHACLHEILHTTLVPRFRSDHARERCGIPE